MKINILFRTAWLLNLVFLSEALADPPSVIEGQRLYASYCLVCHGMEGKGDGPLAKSLQTPPSDLSSKYRKKSAGAIKKSIVGESRHADISEDMPKWGKVLKKSEISALIAYLRFISIQQHPLKGDPEQGQRLYGIYCQLCHGREGDGRGFMKDLFKVHPMDHTNADKTSRLTNARIVSSILNGKGQHMPAWNGILTRDDSEGLVSYIRLLSYPWEQLQKGGLVVIFSSLDSDKGSEASCSKKSRPSQADYQQLKALNDIFKFRNAPIDKVISSTPCKTQNASRFAINYSEPPDFLSSSTDTQMIDTDELIRTLEHEISSWKGKGNLVILTQQRYVRFVTTNRLKKGEYLALLPMNDGRFEEIGVFKFNR